VVKSSVTPAPYTTRPESDESPDL